MLVALVGLRGAGKSVVADYLVAKHAFTPITLGGKPGDGFHFTSADDMLQFVTANWRTHFVTQDLSTTPILALFEKRPFFLLVGIEAPLLQRWQRVGSTERLERFVVQDDATLYGAPNILDSGSDSDDEQNTSCVVSDVSNLSILHRSGAIVSTSHPASDTALAAILTQCQLRIANTFPTTDALYAHLDTLAIPSSHRLRPTWDAYFVSLCTLASLRSNCMKRRVGAVIVRNNRVLSTGYNGTPRGLTNCNEGGCARCNASASCGSNLDECLCLHAEENALLELGRDRGGAQGTIIYCNTYVHATCSPKLPMPAVCCENCADGGI